MAPREAKGGLHPIRLLGSRSLSPHKKGFNYERKDLAKHSRFIKAKVHTQEVRVGDLGEPDAPMGSGWKVFIKHRQGEDGVVFSF